MSQTITFYYEFASPFAYIASELIEGVAERHGVAIEWKPFLLGAVFKEEGTQPLTTYPKKGAYSKVDIERTARFHGVPYVWPPTFPFLSVAAARATYWAGLDDPEAVPRLTHAFFRASFAEGRDISRPDAVLSILIESGFDAATAEGALRDDDVKRLLRTETDAALDRGVFGSPMFFVGEEPFWGVEKIPMVERWLESGGW